MKMFMYFIKQLFGLCFQKVSIGFHTLPKTCYFALSGPELLKLTLKANHTHDPPCWVSKACVLLVSIQLSEKQEIMRKYRRRSHRRIWKEAICEQSIMDFFFPESSFSQHKLKYISLVSILTNATSAFWRQRKPLCLNTDQKILPCLKQINSKRQTKAMK